MGRNIEKYNKWQRDNYKKHPEYKERNRLSSKKWRDNNIERSHYHTKKYRDKVRLEVFGHYSNNGKIECIQCGFNNIDALCLDHINNNGAEHRRITSGSKMGGVNFYKYIRKNGYPKDLQLLCSNCNIIKEKLRLRNKNVKNSQ